MQVVADVVLEVTEVTVITAGAFERNYRHSRSLKATASVTDTKGT